MRLFLFAKLKNRFFKLTSVCFVIAILSCSIPCLAQNNVQGSNTSFADTTGGYGFIYLTVNCFECFPSNLVYYKQFIIVSGIYKISAIYNPESTSSAEHFRTQILAHKYFIDKNFQIWKSPQVFNNLDEIIAYRDEFIKRLKSENYKVVIFSEMINTKNLLNEK